MITRAWTSRLAAMAFAVLLLPACKATKTPTVLLFEQFGTFPGTNWTTPAPTGSATAVKDVLNGHTDPPSLRMTASSTGSSVTTETTASFNAPSVSFAVHMAADTAGGSDGIGTITIRDVVAASVASVTWNETTNILTLTIGATSVPIATPSAMLVFHRLLFSVTGGGTATWTLDNGVPLVTVQNFPAGPLTLELGASFPSGTSWASFYFDNVNITSP